MSRLTTSYVDDGTIMIAGHNRSTVTHEMKEAYLNCRQIAKEIEMDFEIWKTEWMGFGSEQWDGMEIDGDVLTAVKEIRILGYRFNTANNDKAHVDYWIERGLEVRRRIAALRRRFGSRGGISAWETMRLFKSVLLPTIWYGLDLARGDLKPMKCIQDAINDTIRSLFRLPLITATKCILAESGCIPTAIEWRYLQRKYCRRAMVYGCNGGTL